MPFGLIWLGFSIVYSLLERGMLGDLDHYPATGNPYRFSSTIIVTAITAVISGLLIGSLEALYLYKLFGQKSLSRKIVYKTVFYLGIIIVFILINTVIYNSVELHQSPFSELIWHKAWMFFSNFAFWGVAVYIASAIGVSLFYNEVSDNLGQGVLYNFFTGKYHKPVEEERIFMFLDMKSSTTIAEKLGHVRYFEMLREYYDDLSDPIVRHSGEIYQYVGDEVVVSWTLKKGLQDQNCIQCFFAMKDAIARQENKYIDAFGVLPEFKAGFHLGKVTTGEIGAIKKEIIFTGDVLNTTARIQGLCNTYGISILISGPLVMRLPSPTPFGYEALGESELKGRDEKIKLFTIRAS